MEHKEDVLHVLLLGPQKSGKTTFLEALTETQRTEDHSEITKKITEVASPDGKIMFIDTPPIDNDVIQKYIPRHVIAKANVICIILEVHQFDTKASMQLILNILLLSNVPIFICLNKIDNILFECFAKPSKRLSLKEFLKLSETQNEDEYPCVEKNPLAALLSFEAKCESHFGKKLDHQKRIQVVPCYFSTFFMNHERLDILKSNLLAADLETFEKHMWTAQHFKNVFQKMRLEKKENAL